MNTTTADVRTLQFNSQATFGPAVAKLKAAMALSGWVGGPVAIAPGGVALDSVHRLTAAKAVGITEVPVQYYGTPTFYLTSDHAEIVVVFEGKAFRGPSRSPEENVYTAKMIGQLTDCLMKSPAWSPENNQVTWTPIAEFDPTTFAGRQWDACND